MPTYASLNPQALLLSLLPPVYFESLVFATCTAPLNGYCSHRRYETHEHGKLIKLQETCSTP
jgi:hypothetical protein